MIQIEESEGIYIKKHMNRHGNVQQLMNSSMKNKYNDSELINSYRKAYVCLLYTSLQYLHNTLTGGINNLIATVSALTATNSVRHFDESHQWSQHTAAGI